MTATLTDLDALYPQTEDDATADRMATWLAARALRKHRVEIPHLRSLWAEQAEAWPDTAERDALGHALNAGIAEYALAYALRKMPLSVADRLAREIWAAYDSDGEGCAADLSEWLDEEGIDPGQVATCG